MLVKTKIITICFIFSLINVPVSSYGADTIYYEPEWGEFLSGNDFDSIYDSVIKGNYLYVTGFTFSNDFPVTNGVYSEGIGGKENAFVTKFDLNTREIIFSTQFGGDERDRAHGINIMDNGNIVIVGDTESANFPVTNDALIVNWTRLKSSTVLSLYSLLMVVNYYIQHI